MAAKKLYHYMTPAEFDHSIPNKSVSTTTVWQGFTQRTTAHGIPHVRTAKGRFKTGFWAIMGLFCLAFLLYHTAQVTKYFLQYKFNVAVVLVNQRQLIFPAVTVCNLNPVKASALALSPHLDALLGSSNASGGATAYGSTTGMSAEFLMEEEVVELMSDLSAADQRALGYTAKELILSCQYSGFVCYPSQFTYVHDAVHGNCYAFNWNHTDADDFKTSFKTGRRFGLKLILNILQDEYVDGITEGAGARVVVHAQDDMPLPQDEGILATPGRMTSVGVRQHYTQRLPAPHGDCTDPDVHDEYRNVFEEHFPVKYSSNGCFKTCYQRELIKQCACADASYPRYGVAFDYVDVDACKRSDDVQESCRQEVLARYKDDQVNCDCPNPCRETSYATSTSGSDWPSDIHEASLQDKFDADIATLWNDPTDVDKYRRNLLKVEIYYEDLNFQHTIEKPAFRFGNYISDLGGILGLWVGCSILSLFELVELGMDLSVIGYYKWLGRSREGGKPGSSDAPKDTLTVEEEPAEKMRKISPSPPPAYSVFDRQGKTPRKK